MLFAGFLLGLFFDPDVGGDMFLRNVGWLPTDYTALCPRRRNSSLRYFPANHLSINFDTRLGLGSDPHSGGLISEGGANCSSPDVWSVSKNGLWYGLPGLSNETLNINNALYEPHI
jgi:hypothetical protein